MESRGAGWGHGAEEEMVCEVMHLQAGVHLLWFLPILH